MELSGGSWIWSASLRYLFMVPLLFIIVYRRKNLKELWLVMRENLSAWFLWSFIGFGLFYAPLCFAAAYSPGWLIAGTWQITIVSGTLLVPLFGKRIPVKGLIMSFLILIGIAFMQIEHSNTLSNKELMLGLIPVIIASFAYPLGNRKMMAICNDRLDAFQRVLGMTIASLPVWLILSIYGVFDSGLPSSGQITQSLLVALSSGVIATVLFFMATDMVRDNMQKLGAIEATQSLEVLFALLGEVIFLSAPLPSVLSWLGISIVIIGMVLHSYFSPKVEVEVENKQSLSV
jgi:hypothetical protein